MKFLVALVLIVTFFDFGSAALGHDPDAKHPDKKDMCYEKRHKLEMDFGQTLQIPNMCGKMKCESPGHITYYSCPAVAPPPAHCEKVSDETLPYPECCPMYKCPEN